MTFKQDLNQWCKETQNALNIFNREISALKAQTKLLIALSIAEIGLIGVLIAVVSHL